MDFVCLLSLFGLGMGSIISILIPGSFEAYIFIVANLMILFVCGCMQPEIGGIIMGIFSLAFGIPLLFSLVLSHILRGVTVMPHINITITQMILMNNLMKKVSKNNFIVSFVLLSFMISWFLTQHLNNSIFILLIRLLIRSLIRS